MKTDSIGFDIRDFEKIQKKRDAVPDVRAYSGTGSGAREKKAGDDAENKNGDANRSEAPRPDLLAAQILADAKEDFLSQDPQQNFRHVTSSSSKVPALGLERQTAFAVKAELEAQGLNVALIRSNPASEAYHLEISIQGGTLPRDAVTDPLLAAQTSEAAETPTAERLARMAECLQGAKAYGIGVKKRF